MRFVVRVAVGTQPIRALFAREKPPVSDAEWDEAGYVEQRLRAYAEALGEIACVRAMPYDDGTAAGAAGVGTWFCCPRTGDRVRVEPGYRNDDDPHADLETALRRIFTDAHAWRRHLLPAYFERHRNWRAVVGAPIQH